jgi:hypothetical protein
MPRTKLRSLEAEVITLVKDGQAQHARRKVRKALKAVPQPSPKQRLDLLGLMLTIELDLGRTDAALAVLKSRRVLHIRSSFDAFDDAFLGASLLMKSERWSEARDELADLVSKPECVRWPGLLTALNAYVHADNECRHAMQQVLQKGLAKSITRFGIPISSNDLKLGPSRAITRAHRMFQLASTRYQTFMFKALKTTTSEDREALIQEIAGCLERETVSYFCELESDLLNRLRTGLKTKK